MMLHKWYFKNWLGFLKNNFKLFRKVAGTIQINCSPQSFESKWPTGSLITCKYFGVLFLANKEILLQNHKTNIKIRKLTLTHHYHLLLKFFFSSSTNCPKEVLDKGTVQYRITCRVRLSCLWWLLFLTYMTLTILKMTGR